MINIPVPPWRRDFDCARDPYAARNALGITTTGGSGVAAPTNAEYITGSADATLTNERVLTNTATVTWDFSTPGQAKANAATGGGGNVSNSGTPTLGQYAKWVTATNIQGVAPATVLSDIGAQPAGSYQPLDATLTALAAYNTNGLLTQTAADTFAGRTLTGPAAGITVSNGNGVAGNPTLALANDLAALEGLSGTNTIYYRSGADTWSSITIGTGLSFTSGTLSSTAVGGATISDTPPGSPTQGQLWWESDTSKLYVSYNDGTSTQWVATNSAAGFTLSVYTVATLPAGVAGNMAFASNCRMFNGAGVQEGAGAGTGGLVVHNGTAWKIAGTNVTAVA